MNFKLLLFLTVISSVQICKSDEKEDCVYENLYGCKDYNHTLIGTIAKLTTGGLKFVVKSSTLLAKAVSDTTPKFDEEFDFIVIGGGSAGATIAARLSEIRKAKVLLIEAGGEENLLYDVPILVHYLQFSHTLNWHYETEPSDSYCLASTERRCKWPRGRVMGGSSVLNYMVATRGHPQDYDGWADMGNTGWSYNDTLKYFKKLEEIGIPELQNDKEWHNTEGPLHISHPSFHTPLAEAFVKAGVEMGYPVIDYNGEKRIGYSYIQCTVKEGERMSTNRAYLYPNHRRRNLKVSKHSLVDKILIDPKSKRAYGVEFAKFGRKIRVKARKEIILSAGAIGSPQILLRSGVGPSDHLREMKIKVIQDAPVGKNLMDHVIYPGLIYLVDQPVSLVTKTLINPIEPYVADYLKKREGPIGIPGTIEGIAFIDTDKPKDLNAYPNIELLFLGASVISDPLIHYIFGISNDTYWKKSFAEYYGKQSWTLAPALMHPRSRGELLLKDKHPESKPKLIANYFDDPEDLRVMIAGIRASIEVSKTKAMQRFKSRVIELRIPGCEMYEYDTDGYWGCAARSLSNTLYHPSGTCKMAPENDPSGVVNPRLQVKGIKGLRVADASVMATIITGHTNIPTVMIAEKLSDMVKEDWGYIDEM